MTTFLDFLESTGVIVLARIQKKDVDPKILNELRGLYGPHIGQKLLCHVLKDEDDRLCAYFKGAITKQVVDAKDIQPVEINGPILEIIGFNKNKNIYTLKTKNKTVQIIFEDTEEEDKCKNEVWINEENGELVGYAKQLESMTHLQVFCKSLNIDLDVQSIVYK